MSSTSLEIKKSFEAFKEQTIDNNRKSLANWTKYKTDLNQTKSLLVLLPKKVSHSVMVPLGAKALVPGMITHTNEFLVNLGDTWFAKRSAWQTLQICDRRITNCDKMIKKLEKEKEMLAHKSVLISEQEIFGSQERPEIIEKVTEEEHREWKEQHRKNEKAYIQQLTELRNKKRTPVKTEEDLWKRLDELELQEELEDELNRLNVESSDEEDAFESHKKYNVEVSSPISQEPTPYCSLQSKKESNDKGKRTVSFASDVEDPLRLEISHSNMKPESSFSNKKEITSPGDIYEQYLSSSDRQLVSVFKMHNKPNVVKNEEAKLGELQYTESHISLQVTVKDIKEKNSDSGNSVNDTEEVERTSKKMSKFKKLKSKNFIQ